MEFLIDDGFWTLLPDVCVGVVMAAGIAGGDPGGRSGGLLRDVEKKTAQKLAGRRIKDEPAILPYREAFGKIGYNPNKFPPSVEALATRVAKGSTLPDINPLVNLINAVSLKYLLPMGAHEVGPQDQVVLRPAVAGDVFVPFGGGETEEVPAGELVYAVAGSVRTRRWIWRQSEMGKVTDRTARVFVPIDGFCSFNREAVVAARDELAGLLSGWFGARVGCFLLDRGTPRAVWAG